MSHQMIQQKLVDLEKNTPLFTVTKDKKNSSQLIVKDGLFKYKVTLTAPVRCQCDKIGCNHLLFVLAKHFNLNYLAIFFIDIKDVNKEFIKLVESSETKEMNSTLIDTIDKYFSDNDCGICLKKLSDKQYKLDLTKCKQCEKFTHSKCLLRWATHKKVGDEFVKMCIYCSKIF